MNTSQQHVKILKVDSTVKIYPDIDILMAIKVLECFLEKCRDPDFDASDGCLYPPFPERSVIWIAKTEHNSILIKKWR